MKTKSKILLGGFTLIGSGGVATLSLSHGFGTFKGIDVLKLQRGKAHSLVRSTSLNGGKKLDLKTIAPEKETLSLATQSINLPQVKLDLGNYSPSQIDISTFSQKSSTNENIQRVKREIGTAERLGGIEKSVSEKYLALFKKYLTDKGEDAETHIKNIRDISRRVKKWKPEQKDSKEITYLLGQDKRKSLQKIYRLYQKLTKERNKFFQDLNSMADMERRFSSTHVSMATNLEDLTPFLNEIKWSGAQIKLTQNGPLVQKHYRNDWGSWQSNPFRKFYDSQDNFQKDLEVINELNESISQQKLEASQERLIREKWERAEERLKYRKWLLEQKLENAKFLIEFKIAQKLLKIIKQ